MAIKSRFTTDDIITIEDYLASRGYVMQFTKGTYEVIRAEHVATKSKVIVYKNGKNVLSFREQDYIDFEDLFNNKNIERQP